MTARTIAVANSRARIADVPGLERLLLSIPNRDAALGARRPDTVTGCTHLAAGEQERAEDDAREEQDSERDTPVPSY